MTAWKVRQLTVAGLVLVAFILGSFVGDWVGMGVLSATALVILVGGFWPRADLVQTLMRGLVRRGMAARPEPAESDQTRRRAQIVEGAFCLLATALVSAGAAHVGWAFDLAGWVLALLIAGIALLNGLSDVGALGAVIRARRGPRAR